MAPAGRAVQHNAGVHRKTLGLDEFSKLLLRRHKRRTVYIGSVLLFVSLILIEIQNVVLVVS